MKTLFPIRIDEDDVPRISGLTYRARYISEQEECDLTSAIDAELWDTSWDRRRQSYGASYGERDGLGRAIPPWGMSLAERLQGDGITERMFDHMLVNEY